MPAGRGQVGQLSIRVLPDTRKFKEDLRKALKRIERTVTATVQVGAELSRGSALKLKREIAALDAEMKVKATVDDADEARSRQGPLATCAAVWHKALVSLSRDGAGNESSAAVAQW